MLCFSKKVGFQNQEGAVQRDVIEKKLGSIVEDKEIFDKLIKDCVVQKESPQETAFFIAKCMREVSPNLQLFKVDSFLTQEQKELRTKVLKKCQEETKVPTNVLENARKGDFQEEPLLKDYFFCINKQSNNLDESGFYKIDVVAEKMKKLFGQERGDKIIQKCIKNLENPLTTSFEALKCIYFEVPETSLAF
uniref:Putative odorant-binding protein 4 n=1 Tax=Anthonomus grandis TaxID=7044 RepID=A0A2P1A493_ANTGR|nr:putative odorant-binding protein 4 [Anthonomus grandis]